MLISFSYENNISFDSRPNNYSQFVIFEKEN